MFHKYRGRTTCRLVIWLVLKIDLMVMSPVIFKTTFEDMLYIKSSRQYTWILQPTNSNQSTSIECLAHSVFESCSNN